MNSQPQESDLDRKLSAVIGLVLGVLFLAGGFWVRQIDIHERTMFHETQGTVVDRVSRRERNSNNQEKITYAPVIEFPIKGDRVRFVGRYESYRFSEGESVVVRYDPKQPTMTARVVAPLEDWTAWGMFGLGGLSIVFNLSKLVSLNKQFLRRSS